MSDDNPPSVTPIGAVLLEAPDGDSRIRRTGEQLPYTGIEHEVSTAHLSRQVSELQTLIQEGFKRAIETIEHRLGGLTDKVENHDDKLDGHGRALHDHEKQLSQLDKRVTKIETDRMIPSDVAPLPKLPDRSPRSTSTAVAVPANPTPTDIDDRVGAFVARHRQPSHLRLAALVLVWLAMAALVVTLIVLGISRAL